MINSVIVGRVLHGIPDTQRPDDVCLPALILLSSVARAAPYLSEKEIRDRLHIAMQHIAEIPLIEDIYNDAIR